MFLIIFRYLREAILELGHQYSVEESRHIISTSFPCHFHVSKVNGSTFEAQSGIFVILQLIMAVSQFWVAGGEMTTRIRSAWKGSRYFIFSILSNSIFFRASMDVPLTVFHIFGSFLPFLCTFDSTHWGFCVLISFSTLGNSFCDFIDLEQYPFMGLSHLYMIAPFCIPFKLWNLYFCS